MELTLCSSGITSTTLTPAALPATDLGSSSSGDTAPPRTLKEIISDLSGLHLVTVRAAILKIALEYFPDDFWPEAIECVINDDFKKLALTTCLRSASPQKELFTLLANFKNNLLKKMLSQQISPVIPMSAEEITHECDGLSILASRCCSIVKAIFMARSVRSAESINQSLLLHGIKSLLESSIFSRDEDDPHFRATTTSGLQDDMTRRTIPKPVIVEAAANLEIKRSILKNTVTHTHGKARTITKMTAPEKKTLIQAGQSSAAELQNRMDVFKQLEFLKPYSPNSRLHIFSLCFSLKESLSCMSQEKALEWMQNISRDQILTPIEKIQKLSSELIDHYQVIQVARTLQYLPLYLVVMGAKKIDKYFFQFIDKRPEYVRDFPTKLIPSFCEKYGLPFNPEKTPESPKDTSLSKELLLARKRLDSFGIRNEEIHGMSVQILSRGGALLPDIWNNCLKQSLALLKKTPIASREAEALPFLPLTSNRTPEAADPEPTLVVAPPSCDLDELRKLSLSLPSGQTSFWHVIASHKMLQEQMTLKSCPYDIIQVLTTLCLAFENLLSDRTHTMTPSLPPDTSREDLAIVEELTRLEMYARDVASNRFALNRAQALVREAWNCSRPGATPLDLERLITTYTSYMTEALLTYHRLNSSDPALIRQTSLLLQTPPTLHEENDLDLVPRKDRFLSFGSTYKDSKSFLGDAAFALNRLYYLLNKDTGPSEHSCQLTGAVHLMKVFMEKWLISCIEDIDGVYNLKILLDKFPSLDPALKRWIQSLSSLSVESRFDQHDSKSHLAGSARVVSRKTETSSVKLHEGDSEWTKAMSPDFAKNTEIIDLYLQNLFKVVGHTEAELVRANRK